MEELEAFKDLLREEARATKAQAEKPAKTKGKKQTIEKKREKGRATIKGQIKRRRRRIRRKKKKAKKKKKNEEKKKQHENKIKNNNIKNNNKNN